MEFDTKVLENVQIIVFTMYTLIFNEIFFFGISLKNCKLRIKPRTKCLKYKIFMENINQNSTYRKSKKNKFN